MMEKQESRSVLSYEGTFYWTENDYIGVYGEETENARFHFTSQADGVSVFTGNMNASGETVKWAYFPYSEEVDVDKNQLSFPMPAERTISNENHSPMIGRIEANNTVRFYHTGGILLLKIVGLPKQASQLVITSEGENSPYLAGTAVIDNINLDGCTYRIENGSKEVVYDVRNLEGDGYVYSIYMPLQVGTYEKVKVTLKNEVGGVIKERSLSNLIVTRGKMTETPTLNFSDKIYAYEVSTEYLSDTDWEGGVLFSNDFFMVYRIEDEVGADYLFLNTFYSNNSEDKKFMEVFLDENNNVLEIQLGNDIYYFSNYTEETFDLTIFKNCSDIVEYKGIIQKRKESSRAMGTGDGKYEQLEIISDRLDDISNVSDILGRESLPDKIKNTKIVKVVNTPITGATLESSGLIVEVSKETVREFNNAKYEYFIGDARAFTIKPQLSEDGSSIIIGYKLEGTYSLPYNANGAETGLLIKEVRNKNQTVVLNCKDKNVPKEIEIKGSYISDGIKLSTLPCTMGSTYIMRAYIKGWDPSYPDNPICDYGSYEKITIPICSLNKIDVSSCNFSNGEYHFTIKTSGHNNDNTFDYFTKLYKNSTLYESSKWYGNYSSFSISLNASEMDYQKRQAIGNWQIGCTIDGVNIPYEFKTVTLKYNRNPYIDLDVQIIDGPRKVGGSRAVDDEEEKYYVKYKVTARTKGSGWIKQVNIKVDGRSVKTGNPKNEGEYFTYTGSKTYKNKSELPTISCEGILINGAKNIQSSPRSIRVASQVP